MRFLRRTECIVGKADNHSKIGENAIWHFRVSKSRWVLNNYNHICYTILNFTPPADTAAYAALRFSEGNPEQLAGRGLFISG